MDEEQLNQDIANTWSDELNNVLATFDILLSGVDALSILPPNAVRALHGSLRSLTAADFALIAQRANEDCETDRIRSEHIQEAVQRTLQHWDGH